MATRLIKTSNISLNGISSKNCCVYHKNCNAQKKFVFEGKLQKQPKLKHSPWTFENQLRMPINSKK